MAFKDRYIKGKANLLKDKKICKQNKDLFKEFFEYQERKGKRSNGLENLDEGCYKTLLGYIQKFKNMNAWFKNKPWKDLTEEDIRKVYDDLEEGRIKNRKGKAFKDKQGYYNKIMKSKPFALAGKKELAQKVIEYTIKNEEEVRFFSEEDFKKMLKQVIKLKHKLALQLSWDLGENATSILKLKRKDLTRQIDQETGEPEYLVNFKKGILKRTRTSRTEPTLFPETTELLDLYLADKEIGEELFDIGAKQLEKVFRRAIKITGMKVLPSGDRPNLKDIRSSIASHLLDIGYTTDEIKSRLGHKPSSNVLDKYVNYKALGKKRSKKKVHDSKIKDILEEVEKIKQKEKLRDKRELELLEELKRLRDRVKHGKTN